MISAKSFMKTYGKTGVAVYCGTTAVSMSSLYMGFRSGIDITAPLEALLGTESDIVRKLKKQLKDAPQPSSANDAKGDVSRSFNLAREGTYLGMATVVDSLVLPLKLAICLPVTKYILKRRGR